MTDKNDTDKLASDVAPTKKGRAPLTALEDRSVVFISHANPENNAITAWLGSRLSAAGYEIWTDLTRLLGGEEMWLDIDDALRFHARKVIVLLSRAAVDPSKEGVRAEIDRAAAYRKQLDDRRFVIPVKIDDVPYDDLPPTIGNRTVIDASENPAAALTTILKILGEDSVPRSDTPSRTELLRWQQAFAPENHEPESADDSLVTNWYPAIGLPTNIHFYEIGRPLKNAVKEPATIASAHPLPMIAHWRRLVSFADWDEVQEPIVDTTPVKLDHSMPIEKFLSGGDDKISFEKGVPGKYLSSLIRQAWDRFAEDAGLSSFMLSEKTAAWYVPKGAVEGDKTTFQRVSGVKGWRKLYGVYGARERDWHFGATGKLMLGETFRLKLTPHIVYTDPDGEKPATASYRRAHCKLWFNAKWRDLLYAYVALLADDENTLALPLGRNAIATFNATPLDVSLPVRPAQAVEKETSVSEVDDGDAADIDLTDLADDPTFASLIEDEEDEDESDTEHSSLENEDDES